MASDSERENRVPNDHNRPHAEDDETHLRAGDSSSDEETDDDDDDGNFQGQHARVSVGDLLKVTLEEISKGTTDLADDAHFAIFESKQLQDLVDETGDKYMPTALHMLVLDDEKLALPRIPDDQMKILVSALVRHDRNLMTRGDRDGKTPLYQAIDDRREKLVQWMCEAHPDINSILSKPSNLNKQFYLHMAVKKKLKYFAKMAEKADGRTLALKDSRGNTLLHLLVEHKRCRKGQLAVIEDVVARSDEIITITPNGDFNNAGDSPYLHHKKTVDSAAKETLDDQRKTTASSQTKNNFYMGNSMNSDSWKGSSTPTKILDYTGNTPSPGTRPNPASGGLGEEQPKDAQKKVNAQSNIRAKYTGLIVPRIQQHGNRTSEVDSPTVETHTPSPFAAENSNATAKPKSKAKSGTTLSSAKQSKVDEGVVKSVERFLKLHYLRSRTDSACIDILYGKDKVTDLELYFDLSGRSSMTLSGFKALVKQLKFEDALQYVAIPAIKIESASEGSTGSTKQSIRDRLVNDGTGRRDLVQVFDGLRQKGVKTILKVVVDDTLVPPHTDEAIEEALRNMDVEVWDWKKVDLCTEVIYNAAPGVREVHLYWGGNNAVLRGWSEQGGLKVLTELRTVWLHQQKGIESTKRTRQYVKDFEDRIKKLDFKQGPIKLVKDEGAAYSRQSRGTKRSHGVKEEQTSKHAWIDCMKRFRGVLFNVEQFLTSENPPLAFSLTEEPIKVALIDDGVDFMELDHPLAGGRTFCPRDEANHLNHPYYASATGHGTVMAKLINLMCPRAQLYVFRLEDHPSEGARQINARSAAQAIMVAVRRGVDIISMSWTLDPPDDEDVKAELEKAIQEADKANILMFCSASDQGAKTSDTYPSKATQRIFTIGAAGPSGETVSFVGNPEKVDFTFPGDRVEVMDGGTSRPVSSSAAGEDSMIRKPVSGSSVATALAAGFAALVLYCVQIRLLRVQSEKDKAQVRRNFSALKSYEQMKKAFQKTIGTSPESKYKFIMVWDLFGKAVEQRDRLDPEQLIDLVADVGNKLCVGATV
ncbi:intracellular serine protease [Cladorrhinum samala]|uniref:Intracellular serine protease n=1 Tax=Cladorrhinum samala TaxID=585594 RepID=A0AAV9HC61_9PEZI|nr:intracellular serine protease [Cladorrhinum samala]